MLDWLYALGTVALFIGTPVLLSCSLKGLLE
jgi:hypothetical protein